MNNTSTLSEKEVEKFEKMAQSWWDPIGPFKPLHELNPTRLEYIIKTIKEYYDISTIENLDILDVGCGGGLTCEPLARLGASVTGIDASEININIAKHHAAIDDLKINYQQVLAEELAKSGTKYSVVLALEIIEHVEDIELFVKSCASLLNKNGILIFSSINQTIKSYLESIIAAEYILKWVPTGTHDWHKFVKPSSLTHHANNSGLYLYDLKGLSYNIIKREWKISENIDNNYFSVYTF